MSESPKAVFLSYARQDTDAAKRIAEAQKQVLHCDRVALIIAGFEVPHCHLHVIPASTIADVSFDNAATSVDFDDLAAVAVSISAVLN